MNGGRLDGPLNNVDGRVRGLLESIVQPFRPSDPGVWDACNRAGLCSHSIASVHAARLRVNRRRGLICTISSRGGLLPLFNMTYGVGKAACNRLAAELAAELGPHGVGSLSLWPGIVGTEHISELAEESRASGATDRSLRSLASQTDWETPLLTVGVSAALACDPDVLRRSGTAGVVAELAAAYGVVDAEGYRLASRAGWIPEQRVPWWLLLLSARRAARFRVFRGDLLLSIPSARPEQC